jgi:hypothetical protein
MSFLIGEMKTFSLAKGWGWAAVLRLKEQPSSPANVVRQIGAPVKGPELTVGLNEHKELAFTVEPSPPGTKVVFQVGAPVKGPKLTVGLNEHEDLTFTVTDVDGVSRVVTVDKSKVGRDWLYLLCEVAPLAPRKWRSAVSVNAEEVGFLEFEADLGGEVRAQQAVGADLHGEHQASFDIAEIVAYAKVLTDDEKRQLAAYFSMTHKVPNASKT